MNFKKKKEKNVDFISVFIHFFISQRTNKKYF